MPSFHVQLSGQPILCKTPLLRRCFALEAVLGSIVQDGQVDGSEFACVWSANLGACLPPELGAPSPRRISTTAEWIEYGDTVERWAFGRGGRGYDIEEWQSQCEVAWDALRSTLPEPETVEEAAAPFAGEPGHGSDG